MEVVDEEERQQHQERSNSSDSMLYLHNLCELHGDACEEEWVMSNELDNAASASVTSAVATTSASRIREALCDYPGQ